MAWRRSSCTRQRPDLGMPWYLPSRDRLGCWSLPVCPKLPPETWRYVSEVEGNPRCWGVKHLLPLYEQPSARMIGDPTSTLETQPPPILTGPA